MRARSTFLAAMAAAILPLSAYADGDFGPSKGPAAAVPFHLGHLHLVAVHDAQYVAPNDGSIFGKGEAAGVVSDMLKANGLPTDRVTLSVNALLVHTGDRLLLLDTGLGPKANGGLMDSLKVAGVSPDQITDVLITHSHGDHVGGLMDADGKSAFPKAAIRMASAEWEFLKGNADNAALVKAIESQVHTFTPGDLIAPGVRSVAIKGHTPGHMGYEVFSGHYHLLDIGDMAHSSVLSLAKPDWTMGFDTDKVAAKATRLETLARLARDHQLVFAPHFPFPGVGHIVAAGDGYKWEPEKL